MAMSMPSTTEPSGYVLEPLREGPDFTLYRGWQHGNPSPVLVVALAAEQPSPQGLRRLKHEYSLAAELDPAWAAKRLALTRHEGRTILILTDPGEASFTRTLSRRMCWSTTPATCGSPASGLPPSCRTNARRPRRPRSLRAPSPIWRPNRPAARSTGSRNGPSHKPDGLTGGH